MRHNYLNTWRYRLRLVRGLSLSTLGDATILDKPLISAAFFVG